MCDIYTAATDDIGRYSRGCEDSLPDDHQMKLNIDMVTHSEEEVNITVSWDHLHLNSNNIIHDDTRVFI